jgi:hypothetical protein
MNFRFNQPLILGSTALLAGTLLFGCASKKPAPAPVAAAPVEETRPSMTATESETVTATVQALNRKKRTVTLKFPDGKTTKVTAGPEIRNFDQIQIGDNVTALFKETVEIAVVRGRKGEVPDAGAVTAVERAPLGARPAGAMVRTAEISAIVDSIDYDTRQVVLRGPEGKTTTVTVSPKVKRLKEVKPGDMVVARFTEALALEVTAPTEDKAAPKKK